MSLKGIISISGMPGLYKVLAQSKSGFIVESLSDKKRLPVASTQRISMLDDISVFTNTEDLPLKDVLMKMKEYSGTGQLADPKESPDKLKSFFLQIVPDFDSERVYASDIKKMINWFHLVKDIVDIEDETETETVAEEKKESTEATEPAVTKNAEEKAPKKKRAVKSADKDETETVAAETPKVAKPRKKKETQ